MIIDFAPLSLYYEDRGDKMAGIIASVCECVKGMNRLSKLSIKYGGAVVLSLYASAAFCSVIMGKIGNFDTLLILKNELLSCAGEMLSAVFVPSIFLEILTIAEKYK